MAHLLLVLICSLSANFCSGYSQMSFENEIVDLKTIDSNESNILMGRFPPPAGFIRKPNDNNTFAWYLNHLPLKSKDAFVTYYNGDMKANHGVYSAVVDLPIGTKNLQQCADAVIRLRAEYLFGQKRYSEIHFNFLSDGKPRFYEDFVKGDHSYTAFWDYLEHIFEFANTTSLFDEMKSIPISQAGPGDVLIQKKQPFGHAVIIVDMVENTRGKKLYMLAQSYMPAQEIQILQNKYEPTKGSWFDLDKQEILTPEWTFKKEHLKRF